MGQCGPGGWPASASSAMAPNPPTPPGPSGSTFLPASPVTSLANPMPFDGALAIDSTGHVWGWGLNAIGDLCLTGLTELRPSELALEAMSRWPLAHERTRSLTQAARCTPVARVSDGVLGTGTTANSPTPVPVVGLPDTARVTALTSSWQGSGALFSDGDLLRLGLQRGRSTRQRHHH